MKKPKIAHIITRLIIGGAQENTFYTVEGLMKKGYDVTLITGPAVGPEGTLFVEAEKASVKIILIPSMKRAVNPFLDTIAFFKLLNIFKREKYDIVHTHSSKAGILARIAAKLAGVKLVIHTIHGLPYHKYQSKLSNIFYKSCERFVDGFTDYFITVSKAMTEQSIAAGVSKRELYRVIRSGFDLNSYFNSGGDEKQLRKTLKIPIDAVVICKIARLFELKGHEYVFDAFSKLARRHKNIYLLLVGDGILKDRFVDMAKNLGILDKIIFAGLIHPSKIPEYIRASDIIVHASLREGLAKVIPQSFACKKPIVSFDVDGAREVVKNDITGCLVQPKDSNGLYKALEKLVENKKLCERMGEQGKKLIIPYFDKNYMVDEIEKLYMELLCR